MHLRAISYLLLGMLGMEGDRVAVALNRDVVPRSQFGSAAIAEGDRIEILEAVGDRIEILEAVGGG